MNTLPRKSGIRYQLGEELDESIHLSATGYCCAKPLVTPSGFLLPILLRFSHAPVILYSPL